jgi:nitrite reductase/ring-hydroxylating ferredoxin subunit
MADAGPLIALCPSAQLQERGDGHRFEVEDAGQAVGAFAVRFNGQVRGFLNRCAHVAMELDWVPGQFFDLDRESLVCATHGALYDPADGRCLGGACGGHGGLRRLDVFEADGTVYWRPEPGLRPRADPPAGA